MNEIVLSGCTTTPLASYLKGLGVLRLLSEQKCTVQFMGFWKNGVFVLQSSAFSGQIGHDREIIYSFFQNDYRPSPLVTPWNGRGGFLEGEEENGKESSRAGAQMVRLFSADSVAARFLILSTVLNYIKEMPSLTRLNSERTSLKRFQAIEKRKGKKNLTDEEKEEITRLNKIVRAAKSALLQELRNQLPEEILDWFDACLLLTNESSYAQTEKAIAAPLLGAGGLDGSMDFGVNYLKRLNDIFDPQSGKPRQESEAWLRHALFGHATSGLISASAQDKKKVSVGQFDPASAGGCNADAGYSANALLNPWDTLLQLEGSLLFSGSAVRRLDGSGDIYASLPFTVAPYAVGESFVTSDESPKGAKRKTAEMWLPLWNQPTTLQELKGILREGRIMLQGKSVTNGFDFFRAIGSLGVNRGIAGFRRTAFLKRSGDAFFAVDLGHFDVQQSAYSGLIDELGKNSFLFKLHRYSRSKTSSGGWRASSKLRNLTARLDAELIRVLRSENYHSFQNIIIILGEIQSSLSKSKRAQESVPPVPRLSERWVQAADDGTPAFRIARALAGLSGTKDAPVPLRSQLFPLHPRFNKWLQAKDATTESACRYRIQTKAKSNLPDTLIALLCRRLWLAEQLDMPDKPLRSPAGIDLDDLLAFLHSDHMDRSIASLLPSLSLCSIPRDTEHTAGEGVAPAAFAVLKLCMTPNSTLRALNLMGERDRLPVPSGLLAQLVAGNSGNRAIRLAWRRLRASGLSPLFASDALPELAGIGHSRAAAALLIPLRFGATGTLGRIALNSPETANAH
ncbi:MAG: type I-U CRISPR-associated protein Csx17 [Actinomycetota bacterium]|nr:type I-U CRISPR-associated protein Csx17 [Actinomycetota bacterium]MCL6094203.1 type I-U CRISPR-associated protein Csx17 [Actinomycetota bacterium]MDA8167453.1 type I-U CRISPR-associated protein Csx17 [Actinomycetota bacterium]